MVHKAILFAACAHEGQKRKGSDIPYIVHPFEVAQILTSAGVGETVICAGLLHDTVEDTSVTLEDIQKEFGSDIAKMVGIVTEEKGLSWEERKQQAIDAVNDGISKDVKMLICADKLSNLRSIKEDLKCMGDDVWSKFKRGKEKQKWYYGRMMEQLSSLHAYSIYQELCLLYHQIFSD